MFFFFAISKITARTAVLLQNFIYSFQDMYDEQQNTLTVSQDGCIWCKVRVQKMLQYLSIDLFLLRLDWVKIQDVQNEDKVIRWKFTSNLQNLQMTL